MKILYIVVAVVSMVDTSLAEVIDRSWFKSDEEIDRFYGDAATERGSQAQRASLKRMEHLVTDGRSTPHSEIIPELGQALYKLNKRNIFQVYERVALYDTIQTTLLGIPGHARYFADEIKREQKEVASYPTNTGPRVSYDFNRARYFRTLDHLPSPETVSVLGEFLSDDIDTPSPVNSSDSDWGDNPWANSYAATFTLTRIGLREPPIPKGSYQAGSEESLAMTLAWWEEIRSGKRTFSFVGQSVEYRFKTDGKWETIPIGNPPDDSFRGPDAASGNRPEKNQRVATSAEQVAAVSIAWIWIASSGAVLATLLVWILLRSRK